MKTRTTIRTICLILIGVNILFSFGCKKSEDNNTPAPTGVTDADGNVYSTVTIGTQVWMVENLKTTKFNDGTSIPLVTDNTWGTLTTPAYCWYNNDESMKVVYGAVYNWFTVNTGKLAPKGWHVASDAEWSALIAFLGGEAIAGGKLKSVGTIEAGTGLWIEPNTGATNLSGFSAYPGGYRNSSGFQQISMHGYWWTSTVNGATTSWVYDMSYDNAGAFRNFSAKTDGYHVRCVKD